jgi:hypothetical protein
MEVYEEALLPRETKRTRLANSKLKNTRARLNKKKDQGRVGILLGYAVYV